MVNHYWNGEYPPETACGMADNYVPHVSVQTYSGTSCPECVATFPTPEPEVRVTSDTGGEKGKKLARFDLIPPAALRQVAEHYGRGSEKYEDHNWRRGYDWSLSFAAMMRHAWKFWDGEDFDPENGAPHCAAMAFHALTLLTFMDEQREFDDRPKENLRPTTS